AERMRSLDLLVVSDFFLSETAELADVVLPSAQWAEEEGTLTNLEGRVIRRRAAVPMPLGVRTDLMILSDIADRLGAGRDVARAGAEEVFEELRRAAAGGVAEYSGSSYERIERVAGVFWAGPAPEHAGTPRLCARGFPTRSGRARFSLVPHSPP